MRAGSALDAERTPTRRVVAHALPRVAEKQPLARGEDEIEEHVTLVDAALAIAATRVARHQVEFAGAWCRGEGAIVQADRADDAIGEIAQARHRREGDGTAGHAAPRRVVEQRGQRRANDIDVQRLAQPAVHHVGVKLADGRGGLALGVDLVARGRDEVVDHSGERLPPVVRRLRLGEIVVQALEPADEFAKAAQRQRGGAFRIAGRKALVHRHRDGGGQRVAQEQAIEAVLETVAAGLRQAELGAMAAVDAPADARCADPRVDRLELRVADREPARDDRLLQELEHGACREARRCDGEH